MMDLAAIPSLPPEARSPITACVVAAVAAIVTTGLVRAAASRLGFVSSPRGERFTHRATPLGGGIAIVASILGAWLLITGSPVPDIATSTVLLAALALMVLGLVDDARDISPQLKLIVELALAGTLVWVYETARSDPTASLPLPGVGLPLEPITLRVPLTVLWIVLMTNAVNLLDNMDGLAGGVAAVAAGFIAVLAGSSGDPSTAIAAATVAGACAGYLCWNFPPARIYMGDAGSLPLGFLLAALAARGSQGDASSLLVVLGGPALMLAVPLFDTGFVALLRQLHGRSMFEGGKDHTSHRLVVLGLNERRVVIAFYLLTAACGTAALIFVESHLLLRVLIVAAAGLLLLALGAFLAEVRVYPTASTTAPPPDAAPGFVVGRRLLSQGGGAVSAVVVDACVVSLCFLAANLARFGESTAIYTDVIARSLPVFVALKLLVFLQAGLYRGEQRSLNVDKLFAIFRAATVGSLLAVALAALTVRLEDYSRAVFILDWIFTVSAIVAARALVPFLRDSVARWRPDPASDSEQPAKRAVLLTPAALETLARAQVAAKGLTVVAVVTGGDVATLLETAQQHTATVVVVWQEGTEDQHDQRIQGLTAAGLVVRTLRLDLS